DRVDAVAERARQPKVLRYRRRIDRVRRTGQGSGPERRYRGARSGLRDPLAIAPQRLDVCQQVVRKGDRLRALHVRVARKDRLDLARRTIRERARKLEHRAVELVEELYDEKTEIQRDLVVPAASRMQLSGNRA